MNIFFDEEKFTYSFVDVKNLGYGYESFVWKFLVEMTDKETNRSKKVFLAGKKLDKSFSFDSQKNNFEKMIWFKNKGIINYSFRIFKPRKRKIPFFYKKIKIERTKYDREDFIFLKDLSSLSEVQSVLPFNTEIEINQEFVKNFSNAEKTRIYYKIIQDIIDIFYKTPYFTPIFDCWIIAKTNKDVIPYLMDFGSVRSKTEFDYKPDLNYILQDFYEEVLQRDKTSKDLVLTIIKELKSDFKLQKIPVKE